MFKIRRIEIETNHDYIVFLLESDAKKLGLKIGDRIKLTPKVFKNQKSHSLVCDLNIVEDVSKSKKDLKLKSGEIGVLEEAFVKLGIKENIELNLVPSSKPHSVEYVRKKFEGKKLKDKEFLEIIQDISSNRYTDVETTFFVLACSAHPLDDNETISLTKAMVSVGKILNFKKKNKNQIIVDKHCIGGIPGNRTTMIVVPIIAAAGLLIPKTSSRSITSPSGTADTMEVLANVNISLSEMYKVVQKTNGCIAWGGSLDLSPADDIIINVEHPLEIDSEGQMIASILSKKKSAGSTHVLLDIPYGKTAKVKNMLDALRLKKRFEKIGKAIGMDVKVILTDGSQPIGRGIGPYLEALDVLKVLKNDIDAPKRLKEKAIKMSGYLLEMGKVAKIGQGEKTAKEILEFGIAYEKFKEIVQNQGKKVLPKPAKYTYGVKASKSGNLIEINNKIISKLAFALGAPQDAVCGIYIKKIVKDKIEKDDILFELHSNSNLKLEFAKNMIIESNPFIIK